jgi:cation diffusion facilitator CzcD-associated flavoprotein CzcO
MPKRDGPYSERAASLFERFPLLQRLDRRLIFASHEIGAAAMTRHRRLLPLVRAISRRQIEKAIEDPELRRKLTPTDEVGCKRVMLTDEWYPALAQPGVELVAERIEAVTPAGVRTADGVEREADVLVLATGFDSHAFVAPMEVTGREGRTLAEEWAEIARAYYGLTVPGFPNMFLLYGPNTNGGTGSVVYTLEAGIGHVLAALEEMDRRRAGRIEVTPEAAGRFDRELRAALEGTVWHTGCTNWYVDENGNDPSQWPWLWSAYRRRTARLEPGAYALQ